MGRRTLIRHRKDEDLLLLPIFGGDTEPDDDDDDDDEGKNTPPKPGDRRKNKPAPKSNDDDDEDDLDGIEDPKERRIAELSRESARRRREKNAEKKRADELQAALDKINNDGKDEKELAAAEKKRLERENATLKSQLEKAIVRTAVANNDKFKWNDVDDVIGRLDFEDLEIDGDTGEVDGLEAQLKAIAKKKPHYLKEPVGGGNNEDNGAPSGSTGHTPRGTGARSKGRQDTAQAQRDNLVKKYKALGELTPLA